MSTQPQMHRARRVAQRVRAMTARAGAGVLTHRAIGEDTLPHLDPIIQFDELSADTFTAVSEGFPERTHRGFETITYMTQGALRYSDTGGRRGLTEAGGIQWLTSARGLAHAEMPEPVAGHLQGFQIWLNLPATEKMGAPHCRFIPALDIPAVIFRHAEVKVLAGRFHGLMGPVMPSATQPFIADVILAHEGEVTLPISEDHQGFIYVYEGGVSVEQALVNRGEAGILDSGNVLNLAAGQGGARLLIVTALPLKEPIVRHGPFVMTSQQDIKQAFTDYQNGLF